MSTTPRANDPALGDLTGWMSSGNTATPPTDPDQILAERLSWLRVTLRPDRTGRCRAYVLMPDGSVVHRSDQLWEDRRWASIYRHHDSPWQVAQTSSRPEKPRMAAQAVPVHHTLAAAERDARTRARHARARRGQLRSWQADVDRAIALGPDFWASWNFDDELRAMAVDRARWILLRLLAHAQEGRCASCDTVPLARLVLDHDHESGRVRGALCDGCNSAEGGGFGATPRRELQLATYLANPPAARFNWTYPQRR